MYPQLASISFSILDIALVCCHILKPQCSHRVLTGSSLMVVALSVSLTFTTMKQIPTLNRGFYVSGEYSFIEELFYITMMWDFWFSGLTS